MNEILVAIITSSSTIIGVILTSKSNSNKIQSELRTHQAVIDEKIDKLTAEVREHNNFARRMPVVEEQVKVINHRIADLENQHER